MIRKNIKEKILIVDDSAETIRLISGLLQQDYQIIATKKGAKALKLAAGKNSPDLILLDVLMPDMDGYEVCKRLKLNPKTRDIPVIFTTILDEEQDETRGFEIGAVDYIGKPLNAAILRARIKTQLELKRHRNQLEELVNMRTAQLEKANWEKEDALNTRNEFLSCITHELRTPMGGVISISGILSSLTLDPEHKRLLNIIRSSANAQMLLLNDIINFSQLEHGKVKVVESEIYPPMTVKTIMEMFQPQLHEKDFSFTQEIDPECSGPFWGDERLLRQVLMNLVGNAIKFTETGGIHIQIKMQQQDQHEAQLLFEVSDTGIGIAEDKTDLIFEEFAQADNSSTRKYAGLGLGLSTAKRLVALMHGEIGIKNRVAKDGSKEPGAMAHFTVRLKKITNKSQA